MNVFLDKFNTYSENKFSYLRLSEVNVLLKNKTADFCFVCPEEKFETAFACLREIQITAEKAAETELKVTVNLRKSHFDPQFFIRDLIKFFDYYASLKGCVTKRDIEFDYDSDTETHKVFVALKQSAFEMFTSRGLMRELREYIDCNYCENIEIAVIKSGEEEAFEESEEAFSYEDDGGRLIRVNNAEGIIGYTIFDSASYICDAQACDAVVLCGKVGGLKEIARKVKEDKATDSGNSEERDGSQNSENDNIDKQNGTQDGANKNSGNSLKQKPNFFKFELNDGTGIINCVYFASEKTIDKFRILKDGSEIIAGGKLEANAYEGGALNFYIRRISLCGLPKDFKINRLKRNVSKKYKNVFPLPYREFAQTDIFSSGGILGSEVSASDSLLTESALAQNALKKADCVLPDGSALPEILTKHEFVVFDIETTGLDRLNDKIIEIGAVKIKNGILTETFSCYVDPGIPIPERITKLTGISDTDVKDAFLPEEILPDLYKFFGDCVIAGYNSEFFDFPFLSNHAQKEKIYFDNKRLDVYLLAKEHLSLEQYKLKDVTAYFGITNDSAHRALSDAVATAKAFIALCKSKKIEIK